MARKIVKYGLIGLTAYVLSVWIFKYLMVIWEQLNPPPPPPPTVAFGKLEPIELPDSVTDKQFTYKLETPQGTLPNFYPTVPVFALPPRKASLLALDNAKGLAKTLGFTNEPTPLEVDVYRFSKEVPTLLTLDINLINNTFALQYQWQNDEGILTQKGFVSEAEFTSLAKNTLKKIGLSSDDLASGRSQVTYLKAKANEFTLAFSLSEADFVRVDLFRADIEGIPVVCPKANTSNVSFIFSGSTDFNRQIILFEYNYFGVDYNSVATYPLKNVASAWEELQKGQAYIVNVKESETETITIRRVKLAFYDADFYQPFLQPVYVFEGDDDFLAYIPAISPEWIK